MRPSLLRPPVLGMPSTRTLTGAPFQRCERSTWTSCLRLGVVGRNVFSAMVAVPLEAGRHVDGVALDESHDGLLGVAQLSTNALENLALALADDGVHRLDFDVEQNLDGRLDVSLGRGRRDLEDDLVGFGDERRLLGDDRRENDVV